MSLLGVVHIGSGSVSGVLIEDKKVVFAAERECRFPEKLDPERFFADALETLKALLADLLKAKRGSPAKVYLFLASPFVAGQLNRLSKKSEQSFKVTEKLVWDLLSSVTAKYQNDSEHAVVDSKIMKFYLNGYPVNAPHDQETKQLEIAQYLSLGLKPFLAKLREVMKAALHHEQFELQAAAFASFVVARDLRPNDESFVLLDIGAEVTELTLVWRGIIEETVSFPSGHRTLLRSLKAGSQTGPAEARSRLTLTATEAKSDFIFKPWREAVEATVKQLLEHRFWSGEVILAAEDEALAPQFERVLAQSNLPQLVFSQKPLEIRRLTTALPQHFLSIEAGIKPALLPLLESVFVLK